MSAVAGYRCLPGKDTRITQQIKCLHDILRENRALYNIIKEAQTLGMPDYYIGAGCVAQTVWNYQNGNPPMWGISDVDFVYYDNDLSFEAEDTVIKMVQSRLSDCPLSVDVKNQARVHVWYASHFGYEIAPYASLEDAISCWPATATAVGVRLEDGELQVHAPFGLNDLFAQILRPNKAQITESIYNVKVRKWTGKWETLTVIPW